MRIKLGYIIHFTDGGPDEEQHIGYASSIEEAEKTLENLCAVSYSGGRPVKDAESYWLREEAKDGLKP